MIYQIDIIILLDMFKWNSFGGGLVLCVNLPPFVSLDGGLAHSDMCMLSERWFNTWCIGRNGPNGGCRCHVIRWPRWHPTSPCRDAFSWWQYSDLLRFHNTALRCWWLLGCQPVAPNNCITARFCLDRSALGTPIFNRLTLLPLRHNDAIMLSKSRSNCWCAMHTTTSSFEIGRVR